MNRRKEIILKNMHQNEVTLRCLKDKLDACIVPSMSFEGEFFYLKLDDSVINIYDKKKTKLIKDFIKMGEQQQIAYQDELNTLEEYNAV